MIDLINDILEENNPERKENTDLENPLKEEHIGVNYHLDYKYADYDFIIEVFRDIMMFSIVKEYKQRKRYNFQQLMTNEAPIDISQLNAKK